MSFVKRAVKKVFNVVKRVVKKTVSFVKRAVKSPWFKVVAIVALSVFTAGLAAPGGWAALTAGAQGGLGSFFGAVGSTMSTGWSAITSSVAGLFGGGAASTAATGAATQPLLGWSATQGATGLLGQGIAGAGAAAGTGVMGGVAAASPLAANVVAGTASKGILAKLGSLLMDPGLGGTMLRQGVMMGIQAKAQKDYAEKMDGYYRDRTVWGGPAYGGTSDVHPGLISFIDEDASVAQQQAAQSGMPEEEAPQESSMAQQMSPQFQTPQFQPPGPGAAPQQLAQQGTMGMPQPTQPPPAANPQQNSPQGLLQLETAGVYGA